MKNQEDPAALENRSRCTSDDSLRAAARKNHTSGGGARRKL